MARLLWTERISGEPSCVWRGPRRRSPAAGPRSQGGVHSTVVVTPPAGFKGVSLWRLSSRLGLFAGVSRYGRLVGAAVADHGE